MKHKKGLAVKFFGTLKLSRKEIDQWKKNIKNRREEIEEEFKIRQHSLIR